MAQGTLLELSGDSYTAFKGEFSTGRGSGRPPVHISYRGISTTLWASFFVTSSDHFFKLLNTFEVVLIQNKDFSHCDWKF